jgi:hypothetical protein
MVANEGFEYWDKREKMVLMSNTMKTMEGV